MIPRGLFDLIADPDGPVAALRTNCGSRPDTPTLAPKSDNERRGEICMKHRTDFTIELDRATKIYDVPRTRLKMFMKKAGGVNACADLYARVFGRGRR